MKTYFLTEIYNGSDGDNFVDDFVTYLQNIIKNGKWDAMSDHKLFLQGGKQAIKEIINELTQ